MEQVRNDATGERLPVVMHRANGKPWIAILELRKLVPLLLLAARHPEDYEEEAMQTLVNSLAFTADEGGEEKKPRSDDTKKAEKKAEEIDVGDLHKQGIATPSLK